MTRRNGFLSDFNFAFKSSFYIVDALFLRHFTHLQMFFLLFPMQVLLFPAVSQLSNL